MDHCTDALRAMVMAIIEAMRGANAPDDGSAYIGEIDWCANPFDSDRPVTQPIPRLEMTHRL